MERSKKDGKGKDSKRGNNLKANQSNRAFCLDKFSTAIGFFKCFFSFDVRVNKPKEFFVEKL